jgi:hypothetical protein
LGNPVAPPTLWNLFRENRLSGRSRNRAGGIILSNKKPNPNERDGSLEKIEIALSSLLPAQNHQHSDSSESEEGVGGGFGDCLNVE